MMPSSISRSKIDVIERRLCDSACEVVMRNHGDPQIEPFRVFPWEEPENHNLCSDARRGVHPKHTEAGEVL